VWREKVPPKASNLNWRIRRGCRPTRDELKARHVLCLLQCLLCAETEKSDWHILFVCQESTDCWEMTGLSQVIRDRFGCFGKAGEVLQDVCTRETEDVVSKVLLLI
jgi:hypothetical protein